MAFDRKAMAAQMAKRTQESQQRGDGSNNKGYFKDTFPTWNPGDGDHFVDFIPYVAGDSDPNAKPGDFQYVLDIWVHYDVGPSKGQFVCPAKNFNKPCPICEERDRRYENGEYSGEENKKAFERDIKPLFPKRRTVYNVLVTDTQKEQDKGVQIWEVSHYFVERHLQALSRNPRTGGVIVFSDPDNGKTLTFKKEGKGLNMKYEGHRFDDRQVAVSDDMLAQAKALDQLIHIPTYEELKDAFHAAHSDDQQKEEPAQRRSSSPYAGGDEYRRKQAAQQEAPESEEYEEDAPAEPTPPPAKSAPVKKQGPPPGRESSGALTCPAGEEFGAVIDTLAECATCKVWNECAQRAEELGV